MRGFTITWRQPSNSQSSVRHLLSFLHFNLTAKGCGANNKSSFGMWHFKALNKDKVKIVEWAW